MNKILLLLVCALILCTPSVKASSVWEGKSTCFTIVGIRSVKTKYVIYAKRNDSIFKIYSDKLDSVGRRITIPNNCEKIRKGGCYNLSLENAYISCDFPFRRSDFRKKRHVDKVNHTVTHVMKDSAVRRFNKRSQKYHYKVYQATNLCGLCILE
jgi:hypothetical protein